MTVIAADGIVAMVAMDAIEFVGIEISE